MPSYQIQPGIDARLALSELCLRLTHHRPRFAFLPREMTRRLDFLLLLLFPSLWSTTVLDPLEPPR